MERLVILDGHAILHRAYHALPPLTNSKGEMVNAVYGFLSMMLRVTNDLNPSYLIVTFDRPKPTFRKKLYKEYQSHRPKMEDGLSCQIQTVHDVLEKIGIPIFEMDGFEADDVIGTIADRASGKNPDKDLKEEIETIIVTGDRDILQLVSEKIRVYMPVKGLSESKMYSIAEVKEKFGVLPSQFADYKALVGDQSDNYPGVAGIGPKTAVNLITQYGSIKAVYQHLSEIKNPTLAKKLEENLESADLSKKLATIVRDVPITIDWSKCNIPDLSNPQVQWLLEELEFKSLVNRLNTSKTAVKKQAKAEGSQSKIQQDTLF